MPWYSLKEALNTPEVPKECEAKTVVGNSSVAGFILDACAAFAGKRKRPCLVAFDGYVGVNWTRIISCIKDRACAANINIRLIDVSSRLRRAAEIESLVKPCLERDSDFGYVYNGRLADLFDAEKVVSLRERLNLLKDRNALAAVICYGAGAALPVLASCYDFIAFFDITRETLNSRVESEEVSPLGGKRGGFSVRQSGKRLSYVDIGLLNKHKRTVLGGMEWYVDCNDEKSVKLVPRDVYDGVLSALSQYPFRLKPIYIPGVWGGQYLKKLRKLPAEMVNCAFSLEAVPQVQSVRVAIGKFDLEIPFTNLLWNQPVNVLGRECFKKFGYYFPMSHNYDDTSQGGHLAIQVHPNGRYLKRHFNERVRRDETYYIVKKWNGARTYHGLRDDTNLEELRALAVRAERRGIPFDYEQYVNSWQSRPGNLMLIPAGTIHASGANQLVLQIDSDPSRNGQEYTFHIYDYLRKSLDGALRAIHIDHAFAVIRPHRRTGWVGKHLKQQPTLVRSGSSWAEHSLGRCRDLYYRIHRVEFSHSVEDKTKGKFHILTLVAGRSVVVRSQQYPERQHELKFTETIIVPACLGRYSIVNTGKKPCKVVKSFIK